MTGKNPLTQYYRTFSMYIKIPSGSNFYPEGIINFTDSGEVGVMPMTGKDELYLKNPDALLNGEALIEIMKSCTPAVKNPKALLTNDIDALVTAIRYATFNDTLETTIDCPKCGHENTFKTDLQYALDNMTMLEDEYVINLENGLSIFVKPYTFVDMIKSLHAQFERSKIIRSIEGQDLGDEERARMFNMAFLELAKTKFELISSAIVKVVDESKGVNVIDKTHINEFLQNVEKSTIDKIDKLIDEINQVGIKRTFKATCEKCTHSWDNEIDFNPVNFS